MRITRRLRDSKLSGWLLILILLLVWEISVESGIFETVSLPAFSSVFTVWINLILGGEILPPIWATMTRMFIGYFAAVLCAIAVGFLMGYFRSVYNLLEPVTEMLRPMPSPAYIPILILFLGIGDSMKLFIIFFASFWPILLNAYSGVRSVDSIQIETARTFGLSDWQIIRKVMLPAAAPQIFTGMRISLGIAFIVSILAEMIASNDGIGHFILFAQRSFRVRDMYAGVICIGIVGYFLNYLFVTVERRVLAWHYGSTKKNTDA